MKSSITAQPMHGSRSKWAQNTSYNLYYLTMEEFSRYMTHSAFYKQQKIDFLHTIKKILPNSPYKYKFQKNYICELRRLTDCCGCTKGCKR